MSIKRLNELFYYKEGELYRKISVGSRGKKGEKAGYDNGGGYRQVLVDGKRYKVHRIIFALQYDHFPEVVDHIDGDPSNNCITNLRACTQAQNMCNRAICSRNTSGVKGVSWSKTANKWLARIGANGKSYTLGFFDDLELAKLVVQEARESLHGEFARDN